MTLTADNWTLELYGRFHGADVRLSTLELDASMSGSLQVGPERAVWMVSPSVKLLRYEPTDGLLKAPAESIAQALLESWGSLASSTIPAAWLPPTPQPSDVNASLSGAYLVFSANH